MRRLFEQQLVQTFPRNVGQEVHRVRLLRLIQARVDSFETLNQFGEQMPQALKKIADDYKRQVTLESQKKEEALLEEQRKKCLRAQQEKLLQSLNASYRACQSFYDKSEQAFCRAAEADIRVVEKQIEQAKIEREAQEQAKKMERSVIVGWAHELLVGNVLAEIKRQEDERLRQEREQHEREMNAVIIANQKHAETRRRTDELRAMRILCAYEKTCWRKLNLLRNNWCEEHKLLRGNFDKEAVQVFAKDNAQLRQKEADGVKKHEEEVVILNTQMGELNAALALSRGQFLEVSGLNLQLHEKLAEKPLIPVISEACSRGNNAVKQPEACSSAESLAKKSKNGCFRYDPYLPEGYVLSQKRQKPKTLDFGSYEKLFCGITSLKNGGFYE